MADPFPPAPILTDDGQPWPDQSGAFPPAPPPADSGYWWPHILNAMKAIPQSLWSGATYPGDVATGKAQVGDIGRTLDMAGVATLGAGLGEAPEDALRAGLSRPPVLKRGDVSSMGHLPNLRNLSVDQATEIAKRDPHLIPAGAGSPGAFVGGPANIKSMRGLTNQRNAFDAYVAENPAGGDWYDRYRQGISSVTGNQPQDNLWMSKLEGQMSAGNSPEGELGGALKENSGMLAGMPVKAMRPAQHQALVDAITANDPNLMARGQKTNMYAQKVNPDQAGPPGATGVNDFRMARALGYTEPTGEPATKSVKGAPQTFMDYETANAVRRANEANLGGRSDWTGEQLQAAPWVHQKANSILDQRPALTQKYLDQGMGPEDARAVAYGDAFRLANTTIADFFPKHTAFATHEAVPGSLTGHLPGSIGAPAAEREAYTADPRSTWANAPGGRDAIYGGLRVGDTGVAGRVLPTQDMTGMYTPPGGVPESNPGFTARPLVAIQNGPKGVKSIAPADQALLQAGEMTRAYIDAQNAGAAHKVLTGGSPGSQNSYSIPLDRPATTAEIQALQATGRPKGLPDVSDTGQGLTVTNFEGAPSAGSPKARKALVDALTQASPQGAGVPIRSQVQGVYAGLEDEWQKGIGSGAATDKLLAQYQNPQMEAAFTNNPYIPGNAAARAARDVDWSGGAFPNPPPITAYHGSPHSFDKFDMSKIGTGEGAQAYGHGLYFAGNEGVAKNYRDQLAPGMRQMVGDEEYDSSNPVHLAANYANMVKSGMPLEEAVETLQTRGDSIANQAAELLKRGNLPSRSLAPAGHMYQVGINADPEHFLDWDKPLSEQHPKVQGALTDLAQKHGIELSGQAPNGNQWQLDPSQIYDRIATQQGGVGATQEAASQVLREAGIPGIKYLDQGSRASGEGTSNYVLFNDALAKIQQRNGEAVGEDAAAVPNWGPVRPDIQTARGIIGQGPGWIDRLRKARAAGVSLPAIGAGALMLPGAFPPAPPGGRISQ